LVHDGWMLYKALECQHALCNAHHLRELTYLLEELVHAWAGDEAILAQAAVDNPEVPSTGKRGRPKQSKATNLIGRLRDYKDDVWRFMTQPDVPFTNNLAEQNVRMPKVKQKVSGCFKRSLRSRRKTADRLPNYRESLLGLQARG
jgi:transposase